MQGVDVIDLPSRPWEAWYPQYEGTRCKTIYLDQETGESLKLAYVPPRFRVPVHERHHHGTTREFVFMLSGDLPYVEYASPTSGPRPFTFQEGMLLDRPPFSIHGISNDAVSSLGAFLLEWTTGPNTFHDVPWNISVEDGPRNWASPLVIDAHRRGWEPHPTHSEWSVKYLSRGEAGSVPGHHPVALVHIPAAAADVTVRPTAGDGIKPWAYVVAGSGHAVVDASGTDANDLRLAAGTWIRWHEGLDTVISGRSSAEFGLQLLCVGTDLA